MTSWIVLLALAGVFVWAVRRGPARPPFPYGYEGERQLAELRGLVDACGRPRPVASRTTPACSAGGGRRGWAGDRRPRATA